MPESPTPDIRIIPDGPEFDYERLAIDLIRRLSPSGASVCDPFMDKGAVGRAALKTGRTYIGIEKETMPFLLRPISLEVSGFDTATSSIPHLASEMRSVSHA